MGMGAGKKRALRLRDCGNRILSRHVTKGFRQRCEPSDYLDRLVDDLVCIGHPFYRSVIRVLK